jgi:hypothetical protein
VKQEASPKESMKMKQEVVSLQPVVHGLLWLDPLGILSSFFHVSGRHQSWIIIMEEVGPIGSTRGFTKGEHEDETISGELKACSS